LPNALKSQVQKYKLHRSDKFKKTYFWSHFWTLIQKKLIPDSKVKKALDTGEVRWRVGGGMAGLA
jgi:hypothetical protein